MATDPNVPGLSGTPHVERRRGKYEITVTNTTGLCAITVTLAADTSRTRAIQRANEYLGLHAIPGMSVQVHSWGGRPDAPERDRPTEEQLEYHAVVDPERRIRRVRR